MRITSVLAATALAVSCLSAPAAYAGVTAAAMQQGAYYKQTGPVTVVPVNNFTGNYFFGASITSADPSDFDGGVFTLPDGTTSYPMIKVGPPFPAISYGTFAQSPATLASLFPSGAYTLTATNSVTSASQSVQVQYVDDFVINSIPALTATSFHDLLRPNALPLTVNFEGFTPDPRSTSSLVSFNLVGSQFNTNNPPKIFSSGPLPASTTSVVVPAGFLTKGWLYTVSVIDVQLMAGDYNGIPVNLSGASLLQTATFTVAVPEPASWALLLLGFGAMGSVLRQRRARAQPV
jgi:hypothetical protein